MIEGKIGPNSFPGQAIQGLIGKRARYQGGIYEILEILADDPPMLVLQDSGHTTIQPDQYGEAHRRVPQTVTVPVLFGADRTPDLARMEIELLEPRPAAVNSISA